MIDVPTIDELLKDAAVLQSEYGAADIEDLCDLALRELEMPPVLPASSPAEGPQEPTVGQPDIMAEPALYATDEEHSGHDLDLMASLFVSIPQVAILLEELMRQRIAPEGALVFACMLHLMGQDDHARFWWRFAAGAGVYGGAFCLFLYHRSRSEYRKARHWRAQAKQLAAVPAPRTGRSVDLPELLAENIGRVLLHECKRRDGNPQLPADVVSALNLLIAAATPAPGPVTESIAAERQRRIGDVAAAGLRVLNDVIAGRHPRVSRQTQMHPHGCTSKKSQLMAGRTVHESPTPV